MALHFSSEEFADRRARLDTQMDARGLDGLLLFAQESMYWLTGYDTFGYCFFQCLVVPRHGEPVLLTRSADYRQARHTSNIGDIRIWTDKGGAEPATQLAALLDDMGLAGKRLGMETMTQGLTYANGRAVTAACNTTGVLVDVGTMVDMLRAVKSAEEIVHVRRAAELGDAAWHAALGEIQPGADEGAVLAEMHNAIFRGGGDYAGNEFIIGSGPDALLCRYKSGRRTLGNPDQITLEWAGTYRHYHVAHMRTVCVGEATPRHVALHKAAHEALLACEAEFKPGRTFHDVFSAHARVMHDHDLDDHRLNACGYSLGASYTPCWMDPPMFYEGNEAEIVPGMVLFAHMIIMDSTSETAMCLGRTSLITETMPDVLSTASLDLVVKEK
ncbi:MAG: Xaa-Pro peptidase family protein [Pseudomonadota bacterium]